MIENPHDLHVLWVALRVAIDVADARNPQAVPLYRETLEKIERLRAAWAARKDGRGGSRGSAPSKKTGGTSPGARTGEGSTRTGGRAPEKDGRGDAPR